jgi:uncharacterized membrane protein
MRKDSRSSLLALIVRGFVIILPLLLLGVVIEILYGIVAGWVRPVLEAMPGIVFKNEAFRFVAVVGVFVVLFLLVGALAGTRLGQSVGRRIELSMLSRLPLYNALRAMVAGLAGQDHAGAMKPVLVTVDEPGLQQFGFLLETHADGRSTVFLPGSPNPGSGGSVIVAPERVQELHISVREVLQCLSRWGHGSAILLHANGSPPADRDPRAHRKEGDA